MSWPLNAALARARYKNDVIEVSTGTLGMLLEASDRVWLTVTRGRFQNSSRAKRASNAHLIPDQVCTSPKPLAL